MKKKDTIKDLLSIKERVDRLFDDIMNEGRQEPAQSSGCWSPRVDIYETEEHFVVNAEVPGVNQDDLSIQLNRNVLTISGYRPLYSEITKQQDGTFHRIECSYGKFKRSFSLPDTIEHNNIKALLKDGVLQIKIPKKKTVLSRQITIE